MSTRYIRSIPLFIMTGLFLLTTSTSFSAENKGAFAVSGKNNTKITSPDSEILEPDHTTVDRGVIVGKEGVAYKKIIVNILPEALISAVIINEIQKGKTDHIGTYHFKNLKPGTYRLICMLPGNQEDWSKKAASVNPKKLYVNFKVEGLYNTPITFGSKTGKNPLLFESPDIDLIQESSMIVTMETSVNNYGINDDGIK